MFRPQPPPQHTALSSRCQVAKTIANIIFERSNIGSTTLKELEREIVKHVKSLKMNDLLNLLDSFPDLFELDIQRGTVAVMTQLDLCEGHCSKAGCRSPQTCRGLHICKYFILNDSCKNPGICKYGHSIQDPHNRRLLQSHMLDSLPLPALRKLLCRDRSKTTIPRICKFYNVDTGCKNGAKCSSLHLCKHYLTSSCKFGQKCKRSHNVFDVQPKTILESHGFNTKKSPKAVLQDLKESLEVVNDNSSTSSNLSGRTTPPKNIAQYDAVSDTVPSVCMFHLRGQCSYGGACKNAHTIKPYLWQYIYWSDTSKWNNCSDLACDALERAYCDVKKEKLRICLDGQVFQQDVVKVNLEKMTYEHVTGKQKIRRLSTMSSVKNPAYDFTTRWQWWWQDEAGVWTLFGQMNKLGMQTGVTSADLEKNYQDNDTGRVEFSTHEHRYVLDFQQMTQQNKQYKTQRKVRRRPLMYQPGQDKAVAAGEAVGGARPKTYAALKNKEDEPQNMLFSCPPHWDSKAKADNPFYQLVEIFDRGQTQKEYQLASQRFFQTMPSSKIKSIQRIQNAELWDAYDRCRKWMRTKLEGEEQVTELSLFHGTRKDYIAAICQQGFDWRISGSSTGTLYGQGSYFAKRANYSRSYTDCSSLFLVKVLVGKYTRGNPSMKRPPAISSDQHNAFTLYDSTVDNEADPSIYVTYKLEQSYPEFIIEYQ